MGSLFLGLFFGYRLRVNGKIKVKGQIDKNCYSLNPMFDMRHGNALHTNVFKVNVFYIDMR